MTDTPPSPDDPAGFERPLGSVKETLLLQMDAMIGQLIVMKQIVMSGSLDPVKPKPRVCPVSRSGDHERVLWEQDGTGMCRDCGAELKQPEAEADPGVSADPT